MRKLVFRALCGFALCGIIVLSVNLSGKHFGLGSRTVSAQTNIQLIPVVSNLSSPLYVTHSRDGSGRLFIVEQIGLILVLPPGATSPLSTPFLDVRSKISTGGERGLLGLAFHPQYSTNRRFFVNYTRAGDGATVISEFRASASNPNVAEADEKVILTIAQPFANHNGGMVEFGPDNFLYIGMGDGGSANDPGNRAQNVNELLGKMLRIDIDNTDGTAPYSSPATNPFFGATPGRDEIYATGLRNPFRWSFDRATGQLYAGDVGQDVIEEIDIITLGGNYGWRVFEGSRCTNLGPTSCTAGGFTPPITEYSHSNSRCSVTGGYVYRGSRSSLPVGSYVFADFCSGEIFLLNNGSMSLLIDTDSQISSFGEDEAGEIYVVGLEGRIFRIAAPRAVMTVSAASYQSDPIATEAITTSFGTDFSTSTQPAEPGQPLPTTLAGTSVRVKDAAGAERSALLFYVSPTQVNYQIPQGTAPGNATITFTNTNGAISVGTANISNIAPGLFSANSTGRGVAAAIVRRIHSDGSMVDEPVVQFDQGLNQFVPVPIDLSSETDRVFLGVFGTGFRFNSSLSAVTATIGGTAAGVLFAGAQPDYIGLDQANIELPRSLAGRGEVEVALTVDGRPANIVTINIK